MRAIFDGQQRTVAVISDATQLFSQFDLQVDHMFAVAQRSAVDGIQHCAAAGGDDLARLC